MSKWTGNQIGMYRLYADQTGKNHRILGNAAKSANSLTLDGEFLRIVQFKHHGLNQVNQFGKTPFKEVSIAPPEVFGKMKAEVMSSEPWSLMACEPLKKLSYIIERDWDPDKFHLLFHSSGYDSRIFSSILMKLREKHGEGWIGKILFLCWEPEGALFHRIMKWEGWKPSQYHVYRKGIKVDYRAELIDFENVWKWVNDYSIPCLSYGVSVADAIKKNLAPRAEEIYLLCQQFGNSYALNSARYVSKEGKLHIWSTFPISNGMYLYPNPLINRMSAYWYYVRNHVSLWSSVPCREIKIPTLDLDVLPSYYCGTKYPPKTLGYKMMAVKELAPELSTIPIFPYEKLNEEPHWIKHDRRLSETTRIYAAKKFNDSWYVKNTGQQEVPIAPELGDDSTEWWRKYVLASLCEHVINQGVKIRTS